MWFLKLGGPWPPWPPRFLRPWYATEHLDTPVWWLHIFYRVSQKRLSFKFKLARYFKKRIVFNVKGCSFTWLVSFFYLYKTVFLRIRRIKLKRYEFQSTIQYVVWIGIGFRMGPSKIRVQFHACFQSFTNVNHWGGFAKSPERRIYKWV